MKKLIIALFTLFPLLALAQNPRMGDEKIEAAKIAFFTQKLSFVLIENTVVSPEKRWVVVAPQGKQSCKLLLAKAANDTQKQTIGNQTGGRVFLLFKTFKSSKCSTSVQLGLKKNSI